MFAMAWQTLFAVTFVINVVHVDCYWLDVVFSRTGSIQEWNAKATYSTTIYLLQISSYLPQIMCALWRIPLPHHLSVWEYPFSPSSYPSVDCFKPTPPTYTPLKKQQQKLAKKNEKNEPKKNAAIAFVFGHPKYDLLPSFKWFICFPRIAHYIVNNLRITPNALSWLKCKHVVVFAIFFLLLLLFPHVRLEFEAD